MWEHGKSCLYCFFLSLLTEATFFKFQIRGKTHRNFQTLLAPSQAGRRPQSPSYRRPTEKMPPLLYRSWCGLGSTFWKGRRELFEVIASQERLHLQAAQAQLVWIQRQSMKGCLSWDLCNQMPLTRWPHQQKLTYHSCNWLKSKIRCQLSWALWSSLFLADWFGFSSFCVLKQESSDGSSTFLIRTPNPIRALPQDISKARA